MWRPILEMYYTVVARVNDGRPPASCHHCHCTRTLNRWGLEPPLPPPSQQPCVRDGGGRAPQPPAMAAKEAVRLLREMRPGSIETDQQERFVGTYSKTLWWRHQQTAGGVEEEEGPAEGAGMAVETQAMHRPQSPTKAAAAAAAAAAVTAAKLPAASAAGSSRQRAECSGSSATPASHDDRRPGLPAGGYPSTPHLPSSPQVAPDDTQLDAAGCSDLLHVEVGGPGAGCGCPHRRV
jgi:hypothetical protein